MITRIGWWPWPLWWGPGRYSSIAKLGMFSCSALCFCAEICTDWGTLEFSIATDPNQGSARTQATMYTV